MLLMLWILIAEVIMIFAAMIMLVIWLCVSICMLCAKGLRFIYKKLTGKDIRLGSKERSSKNDKLLYKRLRKPEFFCRN